VPTRVSGTFAALLSGQPMRFTACSPVELAAGANQVVEPSSDAFSVQDIALSVAPVAPARSATGAVIKSWTSSVRTVAVTAATSSYLAVNENFNAGWHAVIDGRQLRAVRLDGWKQAWLLPAGTSGVVTLTYQPDQPYLAAVIGGLALLALIMLVAAWPAGWGFRRSGRPRWIHQRPWFLRRLWFLRRPSFLRHPWFARRPWFLRRRTSSAASGPTTRRIHLPAVLAAGVLLPATGFWLGGYPGR
jgi:hypothetical protein